jgi:hypothetical protein
MEIALVVLAIVVALVAIDALGKLDERRQRLPPADPTVTSTQKIVVDLTDRD